MKIVKDSKGLSYIDQNLYNHINNIWLTYDVVIPNDKNIYFSKNTTVPRSIADYCDKGYSRVIKKEKAEYVIISKIAISSYPQYFDGVNITDDDTKEVVYGIYNSSSEDILTVESILDFKTRNQEVVYVNQDKLNESLNNGFVITEDNYVTIKELVDSAIPDNYNIAIQLILSSDLKSNWQWIMYLFEKKRHVINDYDKKNIIYNYFQSLNLGHNYNSLFENRDVFFNVITDPIVIKHMENKCRRDFNAIIDSKLKELIGTTKLKLDDFKLNLKA